MDVKINKKIEGHFRKFFLFGFEDNSEWFRCVKWLHVTIDNF